MKISKLAGFAVAVAAVNLRAQDSVIDWSRVTEKFEMGISATHLTPVAPWLRAAPQDPKQEPDLDKKIEKWLDALQKDSIELREQATEEMIKAYTLPLGGKLSALLQKSLDQETASRLHSVIAEGNKRIAIEILQPKLSAECQKAMPNVAERAFSKTEKDLQELLMEVDRHTKVHHDDEGCDFKDRGLILEGVGSRLSQMQPDWIKLETRTKSLMLKNLEYLPSHTNNPYIPANCIAPVFGLLKDAYGPTRGCAIKVLAEIHHKPETVKAAVALLEDKEAEVRAEAVSALISLYAGEAVPQVIALFGREKDMGVRCRCLNYIRKNVPKEGRGEAVKVVLEALKTPDGVGEDCSCYLVEVAIRTLSEWDMAAKYKDEIEPFTNHPNPFISSGAKEALKKAEKQPDK